MALLEEMCHCGVEFEVLKGYAMPTLILTLSSQLCSSAMPACHQASLHDDHELTLRNCQQTPKEALS